ncbi:uncharacterized protein BO72DRAFT_213118 [Aspergillus fijiensis CBS 313.89]|uniref:Uncharacterized protein n=1 Tax=Aspergillus fijiensis CBS 313.89 TaxID=1448319 RepID=A0A8G1RMM5_9EURO|nr:uncharacterized protein BO72DRAFT_213118 [Aspergillus fijiensis CBS 313.89]RAK74201.1 hypothetical protein BO72DRAFT_213118 [Aspergillus fijiensis CBS 313.89]
MLEGWRLICRSLVRNKRADAYLMKILLLYLGPTLHKNRLPSTCPSIIIIIIIMTDVQVSRCPGLRWLHCLLANQTTWAVPSLRAMLTNPGMRGHVRTRLQCCCKYTDPSSAVHTTEKLTRIMLIVIAHWWLPLFLSPAAEKPLESACACMYFRMCD